MGMVTMFTDASVHPQLGTAGWGAWIKGDGRTSKTFSGHLATNSDPREPRFQGSSNKAELLAMSEALQAAYTAGYFTEDDNLLMMQTDCSAAIALILAALPRARFSAHADGLQQVYPRSMEGICHHEKAALNMIGYRLLTINTHQEMLLTLRHVKGHKNGSNRQWVNRECDRLAYNAAVRAAGMDHMVNKGHRS